MISDDSDDDSIESFDEMITNNEDIIDDIRENGEEYGEVPFEDDSDPFLTETENEVYDQENFFEVTDENYRFLCNNVKPDYDYQEKIESTSE